MVKWRIEQEKTSNCVYFDAVTTTDSCKQSIQLCYSEKIEDTLFMDTKTNTF